MRARQQPGADRDRAHGARVAAVNTRLAAEDLAPHDPRLQREADFLDRIRLGPAFRPDLELLEYSLPDIVDCLGTCALLLDLKRRAQIVLGKSGDAGDQRLVLGRLPPIPGLFAGLIGHLVDRLDDLLHLLVTEY